MNVRRRFSCTALVLLIGIASTIKAQDPTPTTTPEAASQTDERLSELEEAKRVADAETALEEAKLKLENAKRSRIKGFLPQSDTKPLEGKVEFDDKVTFSSEVLAYESLGGLAKTIAVTVNSAGPKNVLVLGDKELVAMRNYSALLAQTRGMTVQYANYNASANGFENFAAGIGLAPEIASAFTKSIVDVAALFRTDVNIKGLSFSVETESLTAALVANGAVNIYDPTLYSPGPPDEVNQSDLLAALGELVKAKNIAESIVARYEAQNEDEKKADVNGRTLSLILKPLNAAVDKFLGELVKEDANSDSRLAELLSAERIKALIDDQELDMHILRLKVIRAAGTNTTKRNLFTGTKLHFSGGMIVRYCLVDKSGKIKTPACGNLQIENRAKLKI